LLEKHVDVRICNLHKGVVHLNGRFNEGHSLSLRVDSEKKEVFSDSFDESRPSLYPDNSRGISPSPSRRICSSLIQ
jgi:hypothetical protein